MAYTQHNSPFSRKGKAKREAKRQLKSLYKQGYSDITRTTAADGSVSYAGAGERGPEQKLDRRSRRNIREEARGDKMTNKMNMDQKGNRTTDVKRIGMNRNSSSPLNQNDPQSNELSEEAQKSEAAREAKKAQQQTQIQVSDDAADYLNMKQGGFYSVAAIKNKLRVNNANVIAARKLIMQNKHNKSLLNRNSSSPVHRDGSMKGDQSKTKSDYANFKDTDPGYHGHDGESHGDQSATRTDY